MDILSGYRCFYSTKVGYKGFAKYCRGPQVTFCEIDEWHILHCTRIWKLVIWIFGRRTTQSQWARNSKLTQ